jgi:hypothetical protein
MGQVMRRQQPEAQLQRAVFAHIRLRRRADVFAFHPRNEGRDQRSLAGINSALGVVSGVPDVIIIRAGQAYGIELKSERGRVSDEQLACHATMRRAGATVGVAHNIDEAVDLLNDWGILRGSNR